MSEQVTVGEVRRVKFELKETAYMPLWALELFRQEPGDRDNSYSFEQMRRFLESKYNYLTFVKIQEEPSLGKSCFGTVESCVDVEIWGTEKLPPVKVEKKYKLNKNFAWQVKDKRFYQIFATEDIPGTDIKKGARGGYIEDESCLSRAGSCWVEYDARIEKGCRINNSCIIRSRGSLLGNIILWDDVIIGEGVKVSGKGKIQGNVVISQ